MQAVQCQFLLNGDTNGVLYKLGIAGGLKAWKNPAHTGELVKMGSVTVSYILMRLLTVSLCSFHTLARPPAARSQISRT